MFDKRILVVDDVALNLRSAKIALDKLFQVRIAKSGDLALDIILSDTIDLILLDIEMPGMSGFDFMKALKTKVSAGDLKTIPPVIFVTAHANPELLAEAKMVGGVGYVVKPFDPKALCDHVIKALGLDPSLL